MKHSFSSVLSIGTILKARLLNYPWPLGMNLPSQPFNQAQDDKTNHDKRIPLISAG